MADFKKAEAKNPLESIGIEYEGTTYVLEYTRSAAQLLEKRYGVNIAKTLSGEFCLTDLPALFKVALMMHHPNMKPETEELLLFLVSDKAGLLTALIEMLGNTVNSLYEEPEQGKAISWARR